MNTTINKLELASELAEIESWKRWEREQGPENFYIEEHNGDTRLSPEAQELFNIYYDGYLTIIEKTQTPNQNIKSKAKMEREALISELIELASDEFNPKDVMYLTKKELVSEIIKCAHYYKNNMYNSI